MPNPRWRFKFGISILVGEGWSYLIYLLVVRKSNVVWKNDIVATVYSISTVPNSCHFFLCMMIHSFFSLLLFQIEKSNEIISGCKICRGFPAYNNFLHLCSFFLFWSPSSYHCMHACVHACSDVFTRHISVLTKTDERTNEYLLHAHNQTAATTTTTTTEEEEETATRSRYHAARYVRKRDS